MQSTGKSEIVPSASAEAPITSPDRDRGLALRARLTPFGFMAPAGVLVILFFFIPMVLIIYLSITNLATMNFTTNIFRMEVVGTENFERIMKDQFAPKIFFNTLFYVLATLSLFNVGLALVISLLSTHTSRRAGFIFRALWLLPRITPSVIYILIWKRMMADPPFGILNQFNSWLGQPSVPYYQEHPWVFVVIVNGFVGASFGMIIFTSAIESIPKDLMNASLVDGSSMMQRIRYIILPLLRWPLLFVITYQTLSLLTSFEYILLLTVGGPGIYQTEVWALTAYSRALNTYFANAQWGYGSAFAVVLVVIGIIMATIYMRVFRFDELVAEPKIEEL
ncbi:MAG: sugar ABC transporter permease [Anaerolineales bacterium]|nr:sugar ABC transporter permease [Anaerolineales bacterium]